MTEEIATLRHKRGSLKAQLTLFKKFLDNLDVQNITEETLFILKNRTSRIESLIEVFSEVQTHIEVLSESTDEFQERESFQNIYFALLARANIIILNSQTQSNQTRTNNTGSHSAMNIKLPAISLPVFDGTFSNWKGFYDYFYSIIHSNNELTNIQKLTYFKSSLKGEPHNLVSTLDTTEANYVIAWDLLKKRYDNKRRIIHNHVNCMLKFPSIAKESVGQLKDLLNTFQIHINCLKSMAVKIEEWDAIMVPIIVQKLDSLTHKEWETNLNTNFESGDLPSLDELITFLTNKLSTLETIHSQKTSDFKNTSHKVNSFTTTVENTVKNCLNCSQSHNIYHCESFLKLDVSQRLKRVRELKLCTNCLRKGHFAQQCKSSACKTCKQNHNTLLHFNSQPSENKSNNIPSTSVSCSSSIVQDCQTILSTAVVKIRDSYHNWHKIRVLLDSASQSNFISEKCCKSLGLQKTQLNVNVVGIGKEMLNISFSTNVTYKSLYSDHSKNIKCLVTPQITPALPTRTFDKTTLNIPKDSFLADDDFNVSKPVDMLLGGAEFWSLLGQGQVTQGEVILHETKLGWVVGGQLSKRITKQSDLVTCFSIDSLYESVKNNQDDYPVESRIISDDFYVDDLITGSDSLELLKNIKRNLVSILQDAGFPLRKFNSNIPDLSDKSAESCLKIGDFEHKALGMVWDPTRDLFKCQFQGSFSENSTKRTILAATAQLYDPLGFLAPVVVIAKLIIQELWQKNLSWDENIPQSIYTKWNNFKMKLHHVNELTILRHALISDYTYVEMHNFSDASERAYGSCIYLKSMNQNHEVHVSLLASKSRVAPIKNVTLPRLELCAATLSAQLADKFKNILNIKIDKQYFWCDSTITLFWIKNNPNRWKTYVANRVAEIQRLTDTNNWHHVVSRENPADLISRGVYPDKLKDLNIWWHGPHWLLDETEVIIKNSIEISIDQPLETRKVQTFQLNISDNFFPFEKFSSFNKLKRTIAYWLRFMQNCSTNKKEKRLYSPLTAAELSTAEIKIIKIVQGVAFPKEIDSLRKNGCISQKSNLLNLTPFLDSENVLRVGGRLKLSNFNYGKKHPIILPKHHKLTNLIFSHEHEALLHAGPKLLLATVREKYWPLAGKNIAKKTVHNCVKCFRFNAKPINPLMGQLPADRTVSMYPFYSTGVDYAGPYLVKDRNGRGSKVTKAYIALFICLSIKAIHLELVSDLSTKTFLMAFKRFIARRGKPFNVYSDNGTNFIGAHNELRELGDFIIKNANSIENSMSIEGINWKFIPPRTPHFGGLWEAGVKGMKHHLKRVLSNTPLTFEEFSTLLAYVESTLNSRPLTPLSNDPNDLEPLTPSHFLIGRTSTFLPEADFSNIKQNRLTRFQLLQNLQSHFWSKWAKEYVHELQQKSKWVKNAASVNVGSLVLIKEDNLPPAQWKLGRITKLHPGQDNIVRVVSIRTATTELKRGINKICVLPIECSDPQ